MVLWIRTSPHGDLERGKHGRAAERKPSMRHSTAMIWIIIATCMAILLLASRRFRGSFRDGVGVEMEGTCAEKLSKIGITAQGERLKFATHMDMIYGTSEWND